MSRKMCFLIFVIAMVVILASYVFKFVPITKEVNAIFGKMQNMYLALSAVVCSLIISKTKHYWLIMLGLSLIVATIIQVVILKGALMTIALLYMVVAFIVYAYLVLLSKYML